MVRRMYMIDKTDVLYIFKKSFDISYNQDYFCCAGAGVNLYDYHTGKFVANFKGLSHPAWSKFTSDKRLIVKTTLGKYYIYDLTAMELVKEVRQPKKVLGSTTRFLITPDNKYIIDFSYVFPISKLLILEIETGVYSYFDLGFSRHGWVFKTESESKYYVVSLAAEAIDAPGVSIRDFYELTYESGTFKLQKLFSDGNTRVEKVDYNAKKFAVADYNYTVRVFDTEKRFQYEFTYDGNLCLHDLKLSKNGRYVALAESRNVYVYDLISKECVKSYEVDYACFVDFLENDTKLLIGTWEKGYCVSLW